MDSGTTTITTPVEHMLTAVETAVSDLISVLRDGGLDHHDQAGLLGLLDRAEILRNQWQAVDTELLAAGRDRGIADRECQRSSPKALETNGYGPCSAPPKRRSSGSCWPG